MGKLTEQQIVEYWMIPLRKNYLEDPIKGIKVDLGGDVHFIDRLDYIEVEGLILNFSDNTYQVLLDIELPLLKQDFNLSAKIDCKEDLERAFKCHQEILAAKVKVLC